MPLTVAIETFKIDGRYYNSNNYIHQKAITKFLYQISCLGWQVTKYKRWGSHHTPHYVFELNSDKLSDGSSEKPSEKVSKQTARKSTK